MMLSSHHVSVLLFESFQLLSMNTEKWRQRCKIQLPICGTHFNSQFVVIFQKEISDLFEE